MFKPLYTGLLLRASLRKTLQNPMLEGRFLVAIGKTEWEDLKWDDHTIAEKKTLINEADLVFTAAQSPARYESARKKLAEAEVNSVLLDCSDAHYLSTSSEKDRIGNCFTWIKADPTFQGLQHAIQEFHDRIYVGDVPAKMRRVDQSKTKFIGSVRISQKADSQISVPWFNADIPLNPDLVAIIGNKGSGKSALSDIVALAGNTRNYANFSFLRNTRFRNPKSRLAESFEASLQWLDGGQSSCQLDMDPDPSALERVKYLPQRYLEDLCNELGAGGSTSFDAELRKIIYSHVPDADRLGKASMDELLNFKVSEIEVSRKAFRTELSKVNADILKAASRSTPEFRRSLEEQLTAKEAELASITDAKPEEVHDPSASDEALEESKGASALVDSCEQALREIVRDEILLEEKKIVLTKRSAMAKRISTSLLNYKKKHEAFVAELSQLLSELGEDVPIESLVKLELDCKPVDQIATQTESELAAIEARLTSQAQESIFQRKQSATAALEAAKGKLGEPERLYVLYREELAAWEMARSEIQGTPEKLGSILQLKAEIESLEQLPTHLAELREKRCEIVRDIYGQIQAMVDEFSRLYLPVQNFVNSEEQRDMDLPLDFQVRVEEDNFSEQLLMRLNQRVKGSFMGVDEGTQALRSLLQESDFSSSEGLVDFTNRIDRMLHSDHREGQGGRGAKLQDQVAKGYTSQDLLDFVFGLEFLKPRYSLTYAGQEIGQLSPGERGLLLLVFYLLVDKDDIPIVIDQPEENLDNQTIYKVLVKCIKKAKERRQVIMVTHNPNLAVVCDAEQIIHASHAKAECRFDYEAGAIENPAIRSKVVAILEGTEPAFRNRQQKYRLS
jgi:ABC-type lipoprotein export system ATPase subunit/translation initiation factor 2 beta subunit (eIF-2beta)/eIF-5